MSTEAIVETQSLGRQADDGTWLVRGVDFAVRPSDRLGIVGSSGSGKTVLLRAIAGLDPIQEGQLVFNGRAIAGVEVPAYRTQVVYLQQRPTLFEGTVESNLRKPFGLAVHRTRKFDRQQIVTWLKFLDRGGDFLDKDQQNLSGGERQIAALLRVIQLEPLVLLLDEPTAALDAAATSAVEHLIDQWLQQSAGSAFVWITHSAGQASRVCGSTYTMAAGTLTPPVTPSP